MSHTPGPWDRNIRPARKYPIIFSGRNTRVAQIIARPDDAEIEANCNLIAAAPDLLEQLKQAVDDWPQFDEFNQDVNGGDLVAWFDNWRDKAKKLIAKATGNDQ